MNIVHRDLKPENILVEKKEKNGFLRIKVCDFGTSKMFEKGATERKIVGSSYYIAPEVLSKKYNEKCDMWSCGVIMYILLTSRPPFAGDNDDQIIARVKTGKYDLSLSPWDKISLEAKDLVKSLLQVDTSKRLSAEEALKHPWITGHKCKELFNEIKTTGLVEKFIDNLRNYKKQGIIAETTLAYLIHNNPQMEEIENAAKLFNLMDENGDGKIVIDELYAGLSKYIQPGEELKKICLDIFKNIDRDNNGYIECEEFIRAAIDTNIFINEIHLQSAFRIFDYDGSGTIEMSELEGFFGNDKMPYLKEEISKIDINGDGQISFDEFGILMKNILQGNNK
jgi:calcium-dependent protein kinase